MDQDRLAARRALLGSLGASGAVAGELLAYGDDHADLPVDAPVRFPLSDEAHLEAWTEYAEAAARVGVMTALASRLVQLQFPIEAGISQTDGYRAATRRGLAPGSGLRVPLRRPDAIELSIHATPAGRVPILIAADRDDFAALVRAFSCRNEPDPIPSSMGACIVSGLNNWDRVLRHRRRFEAVRGAEGDDAAWAAEFSRIVPLKALYQDRFIILSRGPYSAVEAADAGFEDAEWLTRSLEIRREHECTHYLALRALGRMRTHLLDELAADMVGLVGALGRYDAPLARRFLGLENHPDYREGGRLENYLGTPPLAPAALNPLRHVVVRAISNIEAWIHSHGDSDVRNGRLPLALVSLPLDELAGDRMPDLVDGTLRRLAVDAPGTFG